MPTSAVRFILSDRCAAPTKIATPCYECLFVVCFLRFAWPRRRASASGASAYPRGKNRLPASAHWGLDEFCGKSKDTYPPTLRGTRVAPLPACDFGTFRILKNRAILDRYQKEGVMRVSSVIAAGLCFLAVAAPSASPAQSPKAKATKAVVVVVKQTNR
jgi:hypothetical protein